MRFKVWDILSGPISREDCPDWDYPVDYVLEGKVQVGEDVRDATLYFATFEGAYNFKALFDSTIHPMFVEEGAFDA